MGGAKGGRRGHRLPILVALALLVGTPLASFLHEADRRGVTARDLLLGGADTGGNEVARLPSLPRVDFLAPEAIGDRGDASETDPPHVANLTVVDLDVDGRLDVVVCDAALNRVRWIRQDEDGGFGETSLGDRIDAPAHVQAVDMDRDGDPDLVVASMGILSPSNDRIGAVVLLENDGAGCFENRVLLDRVARVSDVRAGDLDADGDLDLAVAHFGYDDGETRWMENRGDGTFESHVLQRLSGPIHCEIVDLDADGDPDILTLVGQEWEEFYAFLNDGRGRFSTRKLGGIANEDFGSSGIRVADLDRDGDPDILYTNGEAFDCIPPLPRPWHGVHWLENRGNLEFRRHRLAFFRGACAAVPADLDGDGDLDVAAVSAFNSWDDPRAQSLIWLENDGAMGFARRDLATEPTHLLTLGSGDFDGDGRVDLVSGSLCVHPPGDRARRVTLWRNRWPEVGAR